MSSRRCSATSRLMRVRIRSRRTDLAAPLVEKGQLGRPQRQSAAAGLGGRLHIRCGIRPSDGSRASEVAPVAQGIEQWFPKPCAQVRILPGAPDQRPNLGGLDPIGHLVRQQRATARVCEARSLNSSSPPTGPAAGDFEPSSAATSSPANRGTYAGTSAGQGAPDGKPSRV